MAFQNYISFSSLDNFGQLLAQLERHCIALELLTSEVTEPWREKEVMDGIYGLLWDRINYLEETVREVQTFYFAVCNGDSYGLQREMEN